MSTRSFKALAVASVATFAAIFGGCAQDTAEKDALTAQIAQDKQERETLEARLKQEQLDKEALRQQADAANARAIAAEQKAANQPLPPGPKDPPSTDKPTPSGKELHRYNLAGDGLFAPGKVELNAAGRKQIDTVIAAIKKSYPKSQIRVEAYTDSDPIKKAAFSSNKALSQARAEAVEKYMASKGISASRIKPVGMGASTSKKTKAANRRVEVVVLG